MNDFEKKKFLLVHIISRLHLLSQFMSVPQPFLASGMRLYLYEMENQDVWATLSEEERLEIGEQHMAEEIAKL